MESDLQYATRPALGEHKAMHLDEGARLHEAERFARSDEERRELHLASVIAKSRATLAALDRKQRAAAGTPAANAAAGATGEG